MANNEEPIATRRCYGANNTRSDLPRVRSKFKSCEWSPSGVSGRRKKCIATALLTRTYVYRFICMVCVYVCLYVTQSTCFIVCNREERARSVIDELLRCFAFTYIGREMWQATHVYWPLSTQHFNAASMLAHSGNTEHGCCYLVACPKRIRVLGYWCLTSSR